MEVAILLSLSLSLKRRREATLTTTQRVMTAPILPFLKGWGGGPIPSFSERRMATSTLPQGMGGMATSILLILPQGWGVVTSIPAEVG